MNKPIYHIETMKEINKISKNGFNVISTFSGGGGSSTGYKMAGFNVLWANEFVEQAQDTYIENHKNTYLNKKDIRKIKIEEIFEQSNINKYELDILDGSPPCASFSSAGAREKAWGKVKKYSDKLQRTDDLFYEFSRILKGLMPKVFIAENVSGLIKGKAKGYFIEILKELKTCGYDVSAKVLNAKYLGVPQNRERLIFIGIRNDLKLSPVFPKPFDYFYTVHDVLPNIKSVNMSGGKYKSSKFVSSPTILQSDYKRKDTALFSASGWCMDENGKRKFTIDELKILSSFPSDYIITGTQEKQWERIGRAVPPIMMKNISNTILKEILCKTI